MSEGAAACPVCGCALPDAGEEEASRHVDACLAHKEASGSAQAGRWRSLFAHGARTPPTASSAKTGAILKRRVAVLAGGRPKTAKTAHSPSCDDDDDDVVILDSDSRRPCATSNEPSAACSADGTLERHPTSLNGESPNGNDEDLLERLRKVPLAEQMRPRALDDFVGQLEAVGEQTALAKQLRSGTVQSIIMWGPPGCGKTTLAGIIASLCKSTGNYTLRPMSATASGVADVKQAVQRAGNERRLAGRCTIVFMDEIHRFNKAQQDVFLPHVESGLITLLGATTENPSFSLNAALLSRCTVVPMAKLAADDVHKVLAGAVNRLGVQLVEQIEEEGVQRDGWHIERAGLQLLCESSDGDARRALNALQAAIVAAADSRRITTADCRSAALRAPLLYDRAGDRHYDCVSALHKSIRGSDDNAALYWLATMLVGGEDPRYIARRLVRIASEDVGLADKHALGLAVAAAQTVQLVGAPECDAALAQAAVYLARAPKSVEVYKALGKAKTAVAERKGPAPDVPLHLRNAPTKLMRSLGYGDGYQYNPDCDGPVEQTYMPQGLEQLDFFERRYDTKKGSG